MIRALGQDDIECVVALGAACGVVWDRAHLQELLAAAHGYARVVTADGRVIAALCAYVWPHEAELLDLAVSAQHQRQGHARALIRALVADVAAQGGERVVCEVACDNVAARALYAACGFVRVSRRAGYYARANEAADAEILCLTLGASQAT